MKIFLLILLLHFQSAAPLKFDIPPSKVKCFSEDIPDSTLVLGKYDIQYLGPVASETEENAESKPLINVQVSFAGLFSSHPFSFFLDMFIYLLLTGYKSIREGSCSERQHHCRNLCVHDDHSGRLYRLLS